MTRPNIVVMLTDDHAAHAIGAYGSVVNTTPRIDDLAGNGVRFDNCFATNSLCSPSRATILTGTYSHINGVRTLVTPIDAGQPTFVSALKQAGYRTAIVGKWHMGDGEGHDPEGFDYWDVLIDQGEYHDPQFLSKRGLRIEPGYATERHHGSRFGLAGVARRRRPVVRAHLAQGAPSALGARATARRALQ